MKMLLDSPYFLNASSSSGFDAGCAVVVSGTWDYETAANILGDNLGAAPLPSFEVDGKTYHMGSFNGCKLLGVKPQTDATRAAALHRLAQYLTGEEGQLERFNAVKWGPANLADQANPDVQANVALAALFQQNQYSVPQGQIHGSWWDIAKVIGTDVKEATDEAGLQQALDNYTAAISAVFNMSDEEKNAWSVIGSICGTNWDTDFPMEEVSEGNFQSEVLELKAGDELKCRQGASWDVNFPADNVVVEEDGNYIVKLVVIDGVGEVFLIAA
jgi:arabinogalactan oligomer/maltooligosaccharide transport system substrate-binding protein